MAWVVGVISVGPPLGVDPHGKNAVADPKQTKKNVIISRRRHNSIT